MATGSDRYDRVSMALHWAMAIAIVALFASGLLAEELPRETRRTMLAVHGFAGLVILALVILRAGWRATHPVENLSGRGVMVLLSRVTHGLLYLLMAAVPLSGWWMTSVQGRTLTLVGVTLPAIVERAPEWRKLAEGLHESLANGLVILAVLHAAAAVLHHVVLKDGVLRRMLPVRG